MTRKIFQSIIAVVISVLLLSLALITGVLYNHFETTMLDQLRTTAQFAEQGVEQEGMAYFDSLHAQKCRPAGGAGGNGERFRHQCPAFVHPVGTHHVLRQAAE